MNKGLLIKTLKVQTETRKTARMNNFIKTFCKDNKLKYKCKDGNIYVTKGKAKVYPCIVAHTDTVHKIIKNFKVFEDCGVLYAMNGETYEQTGIGGDDKCGVFIALHFLLELDKIKVVFFKDEESGGQGSRVADLKFFNNVSMIIQPDRLGGDEVIRDSGGTKLFGEKLLKHIEPLMKRHSREIGYGTFTDCNVLSDRKVGVCSMNVSCGYHRAHSSTEVVSIVDVENTVMFIDELIGITKDKRWKYTAPAKKWERFNLWGGRNKAYGGYYNGYNEYDEYDDCDYDEDGNNIKECYYCGTWLIGGEKDYGVCDDCVDVEGITKEELEVMAKERERKIEIDMGLTLTNEEEEERTRAIDKETDEVCSSISSAKGYLTRLNQRKRDFMQNF